MGDLADAIATVVRQPIELTGAGRTDAGVHAWGQVISGDLPATTDLDDLTRRINKLCAPAIAVRAAEWAADDFDARFSALWRHYRYDVWNAPTPNPLLAGRAWFVPQPLAVWAMQAACDPFIGEHDFTSFCRRPKDGEDVSMVRRVLSARWSTLEDEAHLRFEIRANAFCHQMVRSIVGTLVDVGLGKLDAWGRAWHPRRPRPRGSRTGRPALRPDAVGGTHDDHCVPRPRRPLVTTGVVARTRVRMTTVRHAIRSPRRPRRDRRPAARGRPQRRPDTDGCGRCRAPSPGCLHRR